MLAPLLELTEGGTELPEGGAESPEGGTEPPEGGAEPPEGGAELPEGGAELPEGGAEPPEEPPELLGGSEPPGGAELLLSSSSLELGGMWRLRRLRGPASCSSLSSLTVGSDGGSGPGDGIGPTMAAIAGFPRRPT